MRTNYMDEDMSLGECIALLVLCLVFLAICEQIIWFKNKAIYGTDDCFWKRCTVMVEDKTKEDE